MRILIGGLVLAGALLGVAAPPATAGDPGCQKVDPKTGVCLVEIPSTETPGTDGTDAPTGKTGDSGHACYWDPAPQGLSGPPAGPVPCTSDAGTWSNGWHCYTRLVDPQPPATDEVWGGREPGDGAIYSCYQPQTGIDIRVWSANPPDGPGTGPTPAEVAEGAIASLELKAINIGITPPPIEVKPESRGIIGIPNYLWASDPGRQTVGPATTSASAGGITVRLTARLERVEWDMGDGTVVKCRGEAAKGTPYEPRFGKTPSSTCGHTYQKTSWDQPDHQYTVTARSFWRVDWQGAGQSGTIRPEPLEQTVHLKVAEVQVLTQ